MRRNICLMVGAFLLSMGLAHPQSAPSIFSNAFSKAVKGNDYARFSGGVTDADGDPLTVNFAVVSGHSVSLLATEFSGVGRVSFSNEFVVPASAYGETIVVEVSASDGTTTTKAEFRFSVTSINNPPTVVAIVADDRGGSVANPLPSPGAIPFGLRMNDPDGVGTYSYSWGFKMKSGTFCPGEFPQIFGSANQTGNLSVGGLATNAVFEMIVTVEDGTHHVKGSVDAYVAAQVGGCGGSSGGGGTNPVAPSAVLSTNLPSNTVPAGQGFTATLKGTSPETITMLLRASTTNSKASAPIVVNTTRSGCSSGCTVTKTLYAPLAGTRYYLWLDVSNNVGTTSKTLTVIISDSGGNGGGNNGGGDTTCGERNISIKSEATNTVFQVSESERADAQAGGDLRVEQVCFGNFGCENQYFTLLTKEQFLAKYGCVVKGSVRIQYRFSGGNLQTAQSGASVPRSITSFPEQIELRALPSNFTSPPVYTWASSGTGSLSAPSGQTVKLDIASLPEGGGSSVVTLTANEAAGSGSNAQATVTFQLTSSIVRSAQMGYTLAGQGQQKADSGTVIGYSISSFPETIPLEAFDANFDAPEYGWELVSGSGSIIGDTGKTSSLRIDTLNGAASGSSVVRLTVSESSNPNQSVQTTVTFSLTAPTVAFPPTDVSFVVSPPGGAEVDTLLLLTGSAVSGINSAFEALDFSWSVTMDGNPVNVMTNRHRAVVEVPAFSGSQGELKVKLVASEGGNSADPVIQDILVRLPEQYFAHFAVGPAAQGSEMQVELVAVNDSEIDISDALVEFTDRSGNPVEVAINEEINSSYQFSIASESGQSLFIKSPVPGELKSGWLRLSTVVPISAIVTFKTVEAFSGDVINEVSLLPSPVGRRFTTALRGGQNRNLGLALANPTGNEVVLQISVKEESEVGEGLIFIKRLNLPAGEQTAMFLPEIFTQRPIPTDFRGGVLTIDVLPESDGGVIAALLRQNAGSLSTVPLAVRLE